MEEDSGTLNEESEIHRNWWGQTKGKSDYLRDVTDAEGRKHGEQTVIRYTGSPCPERWSVQSWYIKYSSFLVNALNTPPEVVRSQG